jgi:hypothetical protein
MKFTFKDIIWAFIVGVLAFLLIQQGCKKKNKVPGFSDVAVSTTIKYDTIQGAVKIVPHPYAVRDTFLIHDTTEILTPGEIIYRTKKSDYEIPENACNKVRSYSDSIPLADSSGWIKLKEEVLGKMLSRSIQYNVFRKHTTDSIIRKTEAKQKVNLLAGIEYMNPSNYAGVALGLQFKNGDMIKVSAGYGFGKPQYGLTYMIKLNK